MKKEKTKMIKKYRTLYIAGFSFLLICCFMGILCFQYYKQLQETIKGESSGYLQEISNLLEGNVSRIIEDNFAVLGTISVSMKNSKVTTYEEFKPIALEQQKYWNYKKLFLIDEKGIAYDANGGSVVLKDENFLREVIVNKKQSMSASLVVDGRDSVIFAVPIEGIAVDGTEMKSLAACYELSTFDQILSMTAFQGEAYAHIIRRDGSMVVRSSSPNAGETGYNILNAFSAAVLGSEYDLETIREEIAKGNSGMVTYSLDGIRKYMAYTPLTSQDWVLLTFVPVSVVSAQSEMMLKITLMLCGIITGAFALMTLFLTLSFYRHKKALEKMIYVDSVTGGNTIQRFYEDAELLLQKANGKNYYALIYMNIEKFKLLNEQFGRKACDEVLRCIQEGISPDLDFDESMGRLSADNFCILVKYESLDILAERFIRWKKSAVEYITNIGSSWIPQNAEFGIFIIDNTDIPIAHMIDRAKLSLTENAHILNDKMRYAVYDEKVRRVMLREKELEDRMEDSLASREFEVYLQPKYNTQTENIGGAEALIRWKSKTEGMIYPDEFIPLFEKNGFVIQIDLFVFEEVCRMLERWSEEGKEFVKISVNCSRAHLREDNFLNQYRRIAEKYKLPPDSIEIELTETTVFEDVESLKQVIHDIHSLGFGCSMDDFGSGYSSLNLIRDIPVDTLKLDKVFFHDSTVDVSRTESVVGSIISMARALHMSTVAEGVEERSQVEMLKKLDCDFIQGYYFAKPMPVSQFEKLLT